MDAFFPKYHAALTLPNGLKYLNKKQALQALGFTVQQQKNCLFVLTDSKSKSTAILEYISDVDGVEDVEEVLDVFVENCIGIGMNLSQREICEAVDGRRIEIMVFENNNEDCMITIFGAINNHLFFLHSHCRKPDCEQTMHYSVKMMKTLCPVEKI